ncbi:hypothetical protein ACLOJK_023764 [Asimina triloba]
MMHSSCSTRYLSPLPSLVFGSTTGASLTVSHRWLVVDDSLLRLTQYDTETTMTDEALHIFCRVSSLSAICQDIFSEASMRFSALHAFSDILDRSIYSFNRMNDV